MLIKKCRQHGLLHCTVGTRAAAVIKTPEEAFTTDAKIIPLIS